QNTINGVIIKTYNPQKWLRDEKDTGEGSNEISQEFFSWLLAWDSTCLMTAIVLIFRLYGAPNGRSV
ncbi:MAG: hypothetical protein KKE55_02015, partial [Candidatus Omnitrophica bacterium]|nr:hypothetical protein [Candidatus Omnitrophota bacterium]